MTTQEKKKPPVSLLNKPLSRGKGEVSLSAFSFLFSEYVQYSQVRVSNIGDLEKRLSDIGYNIGTRLLELVCYREKGSKREIKLLGILTFISYVVWKSLFGKNVDSLEKSTEQDDEYMINENGPLVLTKFISIPKDYGTLNCNAFVAGIIEGILDAAEFPARVSAHSVPVEGQKTPKTVFLIKFNPEVVARAATET